MRRGIDRTRILDAFLSQLEEKPGNGFRELAFRLGCAHTNLYNFFQDWSSLRWAGLAEILVRELKALSEPGVDGSPASYLELLERHLAFSLAHPAWFFLVWLEPMTGEPEPGIRAALEGPARLAREAFYRDYPELESSQPSAEAAIHALVHGALMLRLAQRSPPMESAAFIKDIRAKAELLIQAPRGDSPQPGRRFLPSLARP